MKILKNSKIIIFVILQLPLFAQLPDSLNEKEAIILAERFVIENGYTNLPADTNKIKLESLSFLKRKQTLTGILNERRNTLKKEVKSSFYFNDSDSSKGWMILFEYQNTPDVFRVVKVSAIDRRMIMMHTDMVVTKKK
jgi:hypothetical protein